VRVDLTSFIIIIMTMQRHVPKLIIEAYCPWEHDMLQVWISSLFFQNSISTVNKYYEVIDHISFYYMVCTINMTAYQLLVSQIVGNFGNSS
jgi:hypothetical protein